METRRDVFQAIADPTRREIIHLIAREPQNLNSIAAHFEVSRQAISLHIKILNECGLLTIEKHGRERHCRARLQQLHQVAQWVEQYRTFWSRKLNAPGEFLEKEQKPEGKKNDKRKNNKKQSL
jgi:DNA-binding transcriptional ArsR family regulator